MDQELKQYLDGKFAEVDRQFAEERTEREAMEGRLRAHTRESCEKVETSLLTAFHTWAQTYEVRARGTSTAVMGLDERLGIIEERVAALERKTYQRAS